METEVEMIDHIDGENKLIYLDASTVDASIHPIEIYREVREFRRVDADLRKYNNFMKGDGNINKGGGKSTERYFTLLDGTRIVPYDTSHVLTIVGTLLTDDGQEGVLAFNRLGLTAGVEVDINYVPPQVEVITVATGSAVTAQDKLDIAAEVWANSIRTLTSAGSGGATAQEVWEYTTRTITENSGLSEDDLHDGLDSYLNKNNWKADTSLLATTASQNTIIAKLDAIKLLIDDIDVNMDALDENHVNSIYTKLLEVRADVTVVLNATNNVPNEILNKVI